MPSLFIGHGSPMNAIEKNDYTRTIGLLGRRIPKPSAIVCISAHWLSAGTWVTHMKAPKTIHDFYGFPKALHDVQYPAPGSPAVAELIQSLIQSSSIQLDDHSWGLDHGTWSVLTHLYPEADVPVVQLSIDMAEPPSFHFELGRHLRALRDEGVLILGSGNIVHNLRQLSREPDAPPVDWALEFDDWVKRHIEKRDFLPLQTDFLATAAGRLSVPTPDHYLPLLYALGASETSDTLRFEHEGIQNGSISMRCVSFGLD